MVQPTQPGLNDLFADYLKRQAAAQADGLGVHSSGEVVLFDAGPVQPIDPRLAWDEAIAVERFYIPSVEKTLPRAPASWPQLVAGREPMVALAFCVGNFPQLVRDFHAILGAADFKAFCPVAQGPVSIPELDDWAKKALAEKPFPENFLALGVMRLARHFAALTPLVSNLDQSVPDEWRGAWENEKAALAWHRGDCTEALKSWRRQEPSVPVLFNRGMAELFAGDQAASRIALADARTSIPESSAWHHLAGLYEALSRREV